MFDILPDKCARKFTVSRNKISSFRYKIVNIFDVPALRTTLADDSSLFGHSNIVVSI